MDRGEVKLVIRISLYICAAFLLMVIYFNKFELYSLETLKYLNIGIALSASFWASYFKFLWKVPFFNQILYRPNLNGTWLGEFQSDWKDKNGNINPPKPFVLVIRQNWNTVSINAFSDLQKTESYSENFVISKDKGSEVLTYLFREKLIRIGEKGKRQGAAEVEIFKSMGEDIIDGHFWTYGKTCGYIKVMRASKREKVESFESAINKWNNNKWVTIGKTATNEDHHVTSTDKQ